MSISLILSLFALAGVGLAGWVVFWEYPKSAVATARNTLFSLRDELFHLGQLGVVPFDSPAYQHNRKMINGMIRYAHDVSGLQLLLVMLVRSDNSKQYTRQVRNESDRAMSALSKRGRVETDRIMRHATDAIAQLVITRSVVLSIVFAAVMALFALAELLHRTSGRIRNHLSTSGAPEEDRSAVEHVIEEILDRPPLQRVRPIIRAQATRYSPFAENGLCPA